MQEEPVGLIKLDASSRKAGALKGEATVAYAEPLMIRLRRTDESLRLARPVGS